MLIEALFQGALYQEVLDIPPASTTSRALYALVKEMAAVRIGTASDVMLVFEGQRLPLCDDSLAACGIVVESRLSAICSGAAESHPETVSCEPIKGPISGGTPVFIHGDGFTEGRGFGSIFCCISFGGQPVPCKRVSNQILTCVSPPHAPGPVTVGLLCRSGARQQWNVLPEATSDRVASFEYVRLEAMYDAIFATTNSFCPVRQRVEGRALPVEDTDFCDGEHDVELFDWSTI